MFKREREEKNRYMIPGQKQCIDVRQCRERERKEEEEEASSAIITVRTKEDQGRKAGGATKRKTRQ